MKLLAALTLGLALQAGTLDDYYKFKAETTWTYKRVENGVERKIVATSHGEESGKVRLDWKEYEKSGELHKSSEITWSVREGGVLTADVKSKDPGQDEPLTFSVFKDGAKKDERWTSDLGDVVYQGKVEVTVPAGTYKESVRTQLSLGDEGQIDFYLAPKVGLVKIVLTVQSKEVQTWELTEFKPVK
jgi:hypothetical protein